jgi:hypothetical protein
VRSPPRGFSDLTASRLGAPRVQKKQKASGFFLAAHTGRTHWTHCNDRGAPRGWQSRPQPLLPQVGRKERTPPSLSRSQSSRSRAPARSSGWSRKPRALRRSAPQRLPQRPLRRRSAEGFWRTARPLRVCAGSRGVPSATPAGALSHHQWLAALREGGSESDDELAATGGLGLGF